MKIMTYKNNILYNYIFTFISSLNFTHGYWMIYLAANGFSLVQLGIFEGVFHITSFLMETPTGAIADVFGRKSSRIIGRLMTIIYYLIIISTNDFMLVNLGFVFCALGYNFESGAREAILYDSLIELDQKERYMKIEGRNEGLYQTAMAIALLLGGFLALIHKELPFIIMILVSIVALIPLFLMKETNVHLQEDKKSLLEAVKDQYIHSFIALKDNKSLMKLIALSSLFGAFVTVSFFYMQNRWFELGFDESQIGIFLAINCICSAVGGLNAHRVEQKLGRRNLLVFLPMLIVIAMFGLIFKYVSIIAMVFLGILDSIFYVALSDYMNRLIESNKRATLISMSSMMFSITMILIFPFFGWIGDNYSLQTSFTVLFTLGLISYLIYIRIIFKQRKIRKHL